MDRNDKEKQEYKLRPGWKSSHLDKEKPNCGRQSIDATPENASPWYLVVLHMSTSVICASKYPSYCILHHPPDIQLQCRRTFHLVWRKHISDITNTKDSKWSFCWPVSTLEAGFRSSAQDRIINAGLSFKGFFHSLAISQENVQGVFDCPLCHPKSSNSQMTSVRISLWLALRIFRMASFKKTH